MDRAVKMMKTAQFINEIVRSFSIWIF